MESPEISQRSSGRFCGSGQGGRLTRSGNYGTRGIHVRLWQVSIAHNLHSQFIESDGVVAIRASDSLEPGMAEELGPVEIPVLRGVRIVQTEFGEEGGFRGDVSFAVDWMTENR